MPRSWRRLPGAWPPAPCSAAAHPGVRRHWPLRASVHRGRGPSGWGLAPLAPAAQAAVGKAPPASGGPGLTEVLLRLPSVPRLRRRHHALLAVVHAPEAVELGEVHVGLHAAVLAGRERVGGPRAEEAPVRAGAAALGVRVGGLQGQGRALAAGTTESVSGLGSQAGTARPCLRPQASNNGGPRASPTTWSLGDGKSNGLFKL